MGGPDRAIAMGPAWLERGFGQSTPMPREYPWPMDGLIDDYCTLMDHLGIERFHLAGANIGGVIPATVEAFE